MGLSAFENEGRLKSDSFRRSANKVIVDAASISTFFHLDFWNKNKKRRLKLYICSCGIWQVDCNFGGNEASTQFWTGLAQIAVQKRLIWWIVFDISTRPNDEETHRKNKNCRRVSKFGIWLTTSLRSVYSVHIRQMWVNQFKIGGKELEKRLEMSGSRVDSENIRPRMKCLRCYRILLWFFQVDAAYIKIHFRKNLGFQNLKNWENESDQIRFFFCSIRRYIMSGTPFE